MIRFASPWIVPVAMVLLMAIVGVAVRRRLGGAGARGRLVRVLTSTSAACLALAAAGLQIARDRDALTVIAVVDRSRSVTEGASEPLARTLSELRTVTRRLRSSDRFGLVVVGARAATEIAPTHDVAIPGRLADVPRDATDLDQGLRAGLSERVEGSAARLLLISDGLETEGDALGTAELARLSGVPVDVLPLERRASPEIAVTFVRTPSSVAPGEPLEVRVGVRSRIATRARLTLSRDGEAIAEGELRLPAGEDVIAVRDVPDGAGMHGYEAVLTPLVAGTDGSEQNNRASGSVRVDGPSRALAVADDPRTLDAFVEGVSASGLPVDAIDPARLPTTLAEFARYDLVVLSDVPARELSEATQRALASFVQDLGGGLLMVGARRAFGLGGYSGSIVERAMPVTFDLRRRRDRMSLSMVIGIDRSGSMSAPVGSGRTKIDLANEAAARSASLLSPMDRVAVEHVDTEAHWTLPMSAVDDPARAAEACRRATSGGGGIYVNVAMREAYGLLGAESSQLRHFLLFSDGSDSEELGGTEALVGEAVRGRITTSIVSMGRGPDTPALERLAALGQGRFYIVDDLEQLPAIFAEETIAASRSAIVERSFRPEVLVDSPILRGIDFGQAPPLLGLALVTPRADASVLLQARDEEPLLVVGQRGVGRSAVFTTDVGTEFGRPWLGWPGGTALQSQLARSLARRTSRAGMATLHVDASASHALVTVDLLDERGRLDSQRSLRAVISSPGGASGEATLEPTGVGRYQARVGLAASGSHYVTIVDDRGEVRATTVVVREAGDELRGDGTDRALLASIARRTGGRVLRSAREAFDARLAPVRTYEPLAPTLGAAALVLFLLAVAMRRLDRLPFRLRSPMSTRTGPTVAAAIGHVASADVSASAPGTRSHARPVTPEDGAGPDDPAPPIDAASSVHEAAPAKTLAEELLARRKKR